MAEEGCLNSVSTSNISVKNVIKTHSTITDSLEVLKYMRLYNVEILGVGTFNNSVRIQNLLFNYNTISSVNPNGNILLEPNGIGNVGIGITNPSHKLHVDGSIFSDNIYLNNNGNAILPNLNVTETGSIYNCNISNLNLTGIGTVQTMNINTGVFNNLLVNTSGFGTFPNIHVDNLNVSQTGIGTIPNLSVGIGTFTNLDLSNSTGIGTFYNLRVTNSLILDGVLTEINTENSTIKDNIIDLGKNRIDNDKDTGLIINQFVSQNSTPSNIFIGAKDLGTADKSIHIGITTRDASYTGDDVEIDDYVNLKVNDIYSDNKVGIGSFDFQLNNSLNVLDNASIGLNYGKIQSPSNSLIVENKIGIGTTTPNAHLVVEGNSNITGIGTINNLSINSNLISDIIPDIDSTYSLGSTTLKFNDIYLSHFVDPSDNGTFSSHGEYINSLLNDVNGKRSVVLKKGIHTITSGNALRIQYSDTKLLGEPGSIVKLGDNQYEVCLYIGTKKTNFNDPDNDIENIIIEGIEFDGNKSGNISRKAVCTINYTNSLSISSGNTVTLYNKNGTAINFIEGDPNNSSGNDYYFDGSGATGDQPATALTDVINTTTHFTAVIDTSTNIITVTQEKNINENSHISSTNTTNVSNLTVSNFEYRYVRETSGSLTSPQIKNNCISVHNVNNLIVKNCELHDALSGGFILGDPCEKVTIDNSVAYNNEFDGIGAAGGHIDFFISNCNCYNNNDAGLTFDTGIIGPLMISNCITQNNSGQGIFARWVNDMVVDSCTIKNNTLQGLFISKTTTQIPTNIKISNSIIHSNNDLGIGAIGVDGLNITGCSLVNNGTTYSIKLESESKNIVLNSCDINNNPILISSGSNDILLNGNKFKKTDNNQSIRIEGNLSNVVSESTKNIIIKSCKFEGNYNTEAAIDINRFQWNYIKDIRIDSCTFISNSDNAKGIRAQKIGTTYNSENFFFTNNIFSFNGLNTEPFSFDQSTVTFDSILQYNNNQSNINYSGDKFKSDFSNNIITSNNNKNIEIDADGTGFVLINNTNVGIGSTQPSSKLDVSGKILSNNLEINSGGIGTFPTIINTNLSTSGVGTIATIYNDNLSTSGVGTITTIDNDNLSTSGIGTITTIENVNLTSGTGTIATIYNTNLTSGTGTITTIYNDNLSTSGIGTITTINNTNLNTSGTGTIATIDNVDLSTSGVGTIATLYTTTLDTTNFSTSGIATVDNIQLEGSTISTINTNSNLLLSPNGTGKIGIGTTNPQSILHITSSTASQDKPIFTLENTLTTGDADATIYLRSRYTGESSILFDNRYSTNTNKNWRILTNNDGILRFLYTTDSAGSNYNIFNSQFVINTSGFVGIGTVNPHVELAVEGDFQTTGTGTFSNLTVSNTGTITTINNTNLNTTGIGTIATINNTNLTSGVGTITTIYNDNLSTSGTGTITTIDNDNLSTSGIGTITTIENVNLTSGTGTIATINNTNLTSGTGTITTIYNDNLSTSGIGTITTIKNVNLSTSGTGTIATINNTNLTTSGTGTIAILDTTTFNTTNFSTSGIATVDNIQLDGNTISTIQPNTNLLLSPNGTGKLGIGTVTPNEKLTITEGNINIVNSGGTLPRNKIGFKVTDAFHNNNEIAHYGLSCGTTTPYNSIVALSGYFGLSLNTEGQDRLRILRTGEIGIGTLTPHVELAVQGNFQTTGIGTFSNLTISGTGTIATINNTNLTSSTGTITTISNTNLNTSGIGTITTIKNVNLSTSGTGTIATIDNVDLLTSGVGTIATLDTTTFNTTNLSTTGIATVDNIQLEGSTISTINTNSNLLLSPNGTGKLGIGTVTPNEKLTITEGNINIVNSDNSLSHNKIGFKVTDAFNSNEIAHYGLSCGITTDYSNIVALSGYSGLSLNTAGLDRLRILQNGNIGIGTINPTKKLHIREGDILLDGGETGRQKPRIVFSENTTDENIEIIYDGYLSGNNNYFAIRSNYGSWDHTGINYQPSTGNVGLGITNPTVNFHVFEEDTGVANLYVTGDTTGSGNIFIGESTSTGGGLIYHGDGTPSTTFSQDHVIFYRKNANTDTEVFKYSSSSDDVIFNGRIGIGNNPNTNTALDINNNLLIRAYGSNSGGKGLFFNHNDITGDIYDQSILTYDPTNPSTGTDPEALTINAKKGLIFSTGGGSTLPEKMRIDSSGNVGIGTNDPQTLLHIYKAVNPTLLIGGTGDRKISFSDTNGTYNDRFSITVNSSNDTFIQNTAGSSKFSFYNNQGDYNFDLYNGSVTYTAFKIQGSNGFVGIGTGTTPNEKLTVIEGNINIVNSDNSLSHNKIGFKVTDAFNSNEIAHYGLSCGITTDYSNIVALSGYSGLSLNTAGSDRLRILETGEIGIGTLTPHVELAVQGNFQTTGIGTFSNLTVGGTGTFTNLNTTGIGTITTLNNTNLTSGTGTFTNINTTNLSTTGIATVDNIQLDGNTISTTDANGDLTLSPNGSGDVNISTNLVITGDFTVNGTTNLLNSTNTEIKDNLILLNNGIGTGANPNDAGILIYRGSSGNNAFIGFDETNDRFIMGTGTFTGSSTGSLTINEEDLLINKLFSTDIDSTNINSSNINISGIGTLDKIMINTDTTPIEYIVTVSTDSSNNNVYFIDGVEKPLLEFAVGKTYKFNLSDNSNSTHPLLFYLDNRITSYTSNVTNNHGSISPGQSGSYTQITIDENTPNPLYYHCSSHSGMGNIIEVKCGVLQPIKGGSLWTENTNDIYYTNGNVGIGSTVPTQKLDVNGNINITGNIYYGSSTRQMINLYSTSYGIGVQDSTTYFRSVRDFQFYKGGSHSNARGNAGTNGTALLTIKDTGNVGIGSTVPTQKLDVDGNINITGDYYQNGLIVGFGVTANPGGSGLPTITSIGIGNTNYEISGGGQWTLATNDIYYNTGNVGIGTNNPTQKLQLSQHSYSLGPNIQLQNTINIWRRSYGTLSNITSPVSAPSTSSYFTFSSWHDNLYPRQFIYINRDTDRANSGNGAILGNDLAIEFGYSNYFNYHSSDSTFSPAGSAIRFHTNNSEKMCIDYQGNVGIGTVNPTQKLDVNGNINITGNYYQNGVLFSGGGSGNVTANPGGSGLDILTTIGIGNTDYSLSSGNSISGVNNSGMQLLGKISRTSINPDREWTFNINNHEDYDYFKLVGVNVKCSVDGQLVWRGVKASDGTDNTVHSEFSYLFTNIGGSGSGNNSGQNPGTSLDGSHLIADSTPGPVNFEVLIYGLNKAEQKYSTFNSSAQTTTSEYDQNGSYHYNGSTLQYGTSSTDDHICNAIKIYNDSSVNTFYGTIMLYGFKETTNVISTVNYNGSELLDTVTISSNTQNVLLDATSSYENYEYLELICTNINGNINGYIGWQPYTTSAITTTASSKWNTFTITDNTGDVLTNENKEWHILGFQTQGKQNIKAQLYNVNKTDKKYSKFNNVGTHSNTTDTISQSGNTSQNNLTKCRYILLNNFSQNDTSSPSGFITQGTILLYGYKSTKEASTTIPIPTPTINDAGKILQINNDGNSFSYVDKKNVINEIENDLIIGRDHRDLFVVNSTSVFSNLNVNGEITATGDITAFYSSDRRLKENIIPINKPLEKLKNINGYYFNWKNDKTKKRDIGVIAQEIEETLPELCTTRDNGYKAVKYDKITAYLIECLKEQQKQIDELNNKIEKLK